MELLQENVSRRNVLRYGLGGLVAVGGGGSLVLLPAQRASADLVVVRLYVLGGERTMVDGLVVPFVGFGSTEERLELPSGKLEVMVGDTVEVHLRNDWTSPVGFTVPPSQEFPGFTEPPLNPGDYRVVKFPAPTKPGTYFYVGTVNGSADTGRALGATGPLVVLPRESRTSVDDLYPGVRSRAWRQPMMGSPTEPGPALPPTVKQERTWLFSEHNPSTARTLAGGRVSLPSDPEPEYFLINGLSGMLSAEDHQTNVSGQAGGLGQPGDVTLVRMINTGRAPRSIHLHGNHFWVMSHPDTPWIVGAHKDTVRIPSGQAVDILIPMEAPPDSYPVTNRAQKYVVHDHIEMAETASGGHYPSGMISELIFE
jgi:FtsP/CotA-like multicopper oxidase with cupredoxin domain